ncbi:MAG TPA: hypothetical protein VK512_24170 [Xanthobacteraceae bacterium]|jgi:hypothetical protein|nr:hypothetical protein [Xanthobacteraceae bacterium]
MGQAGKGGGARYETVELIVSPAKFDGEVLALDIAAFLQTLPDGGHDGSIRSRRRGTEKSHHRHRRLLRARPLGMAFGVTATTVMLSFGTAPAQASAIVHFAEIFTTAASGASSIGSPLNGI